MGSNSSRIGDLPKNEYLKKLSGTESVSENDPFWNQLLSFSFPAPTSSDPLCIIKNMFILLRDWTDVNTSVNLAVTYRVRAMCQVLGSLP
uniref:Dymeclin n=1 Tax=Ovis aries TaxID=9940 RepID=A0AC11DLY6_SHEEP